MQSLITTFEMLTTLLQQDNLSLNEYNSKEETPLISLIKSDFQQSQKKDIIINFINKGCDINKEDKKLKLPPFIHAIRNDDLIIAKLLFRFGANINKKNQKGYSYVRYGTIYTMGDYTNYYTKKIYEFLFKCELYNLVNDKELFFSEIKEESHMKILIPSALDINTTNDSNGNSLLHEAVIHKKPEIVKLLLEKGINKSIKNNNGKDANDLNEDINKNKDDTNNNNKDENNIYDKIHKLLN